MMERNIFVVIMAISGVVLLFCAYKVFGIDKIKSWLVWACTAAEAHYGGGTGKLKLSYVYDAFISKFPKLQIIIPFALFSHLVDEALNVMRDMLKNDKILKIVENREE